MLSRHARVRLLSAVRFHCQMRSLQRNDDAGEPPPPAVDQVGMSVTAANFYRRPLPESCIDFASEQGKKLFKESLLEGYCNIYFKLASQFRTQDEPAYCGLSTLVMVLNSLEVDPERVWKAPWRYYHESMLDCCVPLENVKKTGINLVQFSCLAICNRLESRISHGNDSNEFLSQLRREITESVRGESTVVVASYDRAELGQSGSGHFSPLAAYHSATDSVLIMDVARFKYPPHWVPLSVLQKAMCSVDPSSKKPRGYVTLRLQRHTRPLVMFGVKCNLGCNDGDFATSVLSWREFLVCDPLADPAEELSLSCRRFAQCFGPHALCCTQKQIQGEMEKKNRPELAEALSDACRTVCGEVRQTKVAGVFQNGAVAALMLAWPFEPGVSERSDRLLNMTKTELANFSADTKNEISLLSTQLMTLSSCSRPSVRLDRIDSTTSRCSQKNNDCRCKQDVRL